MARAEPPWSPTGVTVHGGDLYIAEWSHAHGEQHDYRPRVRKVRPDGTSAIVATLAK